MTKSLIIATCGDIRKEDLVGYEQLSQAVGGWIEAAPSTSELTIWCNEEGKLKGFEYNRVATDLWADFDEYGCVEAGDVLVGQIVIQGPTDDEGDSTDCPDWLFAKFGLVDK